MSDDLKTGGEKSQSSLGRLEHAPSPHPVAPRSGHISLGFRETLQLGDPPCTASAPSSSSLGVCLGREGTRTLLAALRVALSVVCWPHIPTASKR